jgi:hypothetical protein
MAFIGKNRVKAAIKAGNLHKPAAAPKSAAGRSLLRDKPLVPSRAESHIEA